MNTVLSDVSVPGPIHTLNQATDHELAAFMGYHIPCKRLTGDYQYSGQALACHHHQLCGQKINHDSSCEGAYALTGRHKGIYTRPPADGSACCMGCWIVLSNGPQHDGHAQPHVGALSMDVPQVCCNPYGSPGRFMRGTAQ